MSSPDKFYLASITNAKCLENTQKAQGACRLRKWNKTAEQQWTLEAKDGQAQTFAIKSVLDNRYLAALEPAWRNGGKIGVADEKQYWTLEADRGPGTWNIKSETVISGGLSGYLNDEWGRVNDDNRIQTWQLQPNNPHYFNFYLHSVDAADACKLDASTSSTSAKDQQAEDERAKKLQEQEAAIARREADAAAQGRDQKAALEKREAELAKREEELRNASAAHAKTIEENADAHTTRQRETHAKEEALAKKEAELAKREQERQNASVGRSATAGQDPDAHAAKQRELQAKEAALAKREADLAQKEHNLKSSDQAGAKQDVAGDTTANSAADADALKAKIAELEEKLRTTQSPQGSTIRGSIALTSAGGVRPAGSLKTGWDPRLMEKWAAGKKAISVRRD